MSDDDDKGEADDFMNSDAWGTSQPHSRVYEHRPLLGAGNKLSVPQSSDGETGDKLETGAAAPSAHICRCCLKSMPPRLATLWLVFSLNLSFTFCQIVAAYLSHSMSLASDSLHLLVDAIGYGLLVYSETISNRSCSEADALTAAAQVTNRILVQKFAIFFSFASILAVTLWCTVESIHRLRHPEQHADDIKPLVMLVMSSIGFVFDFASVNAFRLSGFEFLQHSHGGHSDHSADSSGQQNAHSHSLMGMLGAFLHVVTDFVRSCVLVVASLLIYLHKLPALETDAVCSLFVALIVFFVSVLFFKRVSSTLWAMTDSSKAKKKAVVKHHHRQGGEENKEYTVISDLDFKTALDSTGGIKRKGKSITHRVLEAAEYSSDGS